MHTDTSGSQRKSPWDAWHRAKGNEPSWQAVRAVSEALTRGRALDLGAGYLRDTRYFLAQGFGEVIAVDRFCPPAEILQEFSARRMCFIPAKLECFVPPPESFDICIAANSLYFCSQESLPCIFKRALSALREGGIFTCNLLRESDPWATGERKPPFPISHISEDEMYSLIRGFEVLDYKKTDEPTWKPWHCHNLTLRKF